MRAPSLRGKWLATVAAVATVTATGCGGGAGAADTGDSAPRARSAAERVVAEPVEVEVEATRVGDAMRLDIRGTGRGAREGAAFEDPERWMIRAQQDNRALPRLVNGSVKVQRSPAGTTRWDTVVQFTVVYQVSGSGEVTVQISAPNEQPIERVFRI